MAAVVGNPSMPIFRPEFSYSDQPYYYNSYFERRQAFLRSYRFCRKRGIRERIKHSLVHVKKVVWAKLRSVRRLHRVIWFRLRLAIACRRKFIFHCLNQRTDYYW